MKTIKFEITFNDREFEILQWGKCDTPSQQRVKKLLLSQAASNVRRQCGEVLQEMHGQVHVNSKAELKEINRKRRLSHEAWMKEDADGHRTNDGSWRSPEGKAKHTLTAGEKDPRIGPLGALGLTLSQAKARAKKKPNHSDRSAMTGAEWMDDDNIRKLRD